MAVTQTQIIQLKRRLGGTAGFSGVTLEEGEPAFNDDGNELIIGGDSGDHEVLVSATRQVELAGAQNISGVKTVVAGGGITTPVGQLLVTGAPAANSYLRASAGFATGALEFGTLPAGGLLAVSVEDPITGDGTAGDPLEITPASDAQVDAGTDDVFPITSRSLRYITGDPDDLPGTTTTIIDGIQYIENMVTTLQGAIILQGTWNATADQITPGVGSPITANAALPAAATGNRGWYLIVNTAGTIAAGHNAPAGDYAVGDWILSNGAAWLHFQMNLGAIAAINVQFTPTAPMTATNVQAAINEVAAAAAAASTNIHADGVSIGGLTATAGAGTTAANALTVLRVDGGEF
jgi:hypothetical protein